MRTQLAEGAAVSELENIKFEENQSDICVRPDREFFLQMLDIKLSTCEANKKIAVSEVKKY